SSPIYVILPKPIKADPTINRFLDEQRIARAKGARSDTLPAKAGSLKRLTLRELLQRVSLINSSEAGTTARDVVLTFAGGQVEDAELIKSLHSLPRDMLRRYERWKVSVREGDKARVFEAHYIPQTQRVLSQGFSWQQWLETENRR